MGNSNDGGQRASESPAPGVQPHKNTVDTEEQAINENVFNARLEDLTDENQMTSDEFLEPYCAVCFQINGLTMEVDCFCENCSQFQCFQCNNFHGTQQKAKGHLILRGSSMPGSQTDKPPPRQAAIMSHTTAVKQGTGVVRLKSDVHPCDITGIAVTKDGRRLLVDNHNKKVKMFSQNWKLLGLFSQDWKILASVSIPDIPSGIAVINDRTATVTTENKSLVILNISTKQLSITYIVHLSYGVQGITKYKNKLIVTCPDTSPPCIKLINQLGHEYWSVLTASQGKPTPLFKRPWYVTNFGDGKSSFLVTDWYNCTLTLLNSNTDEIVTRILRGRPRGVTTDDAGNIYVTYWRTDEVTMLSGDLSVEKVLLSRENGLSGRPDAIVYDRTTHQIIVSYYSFNGCNDVECFQLSQLPGSSYSKRC